MESWVDGNTIVEQTLQCNSGMMRFIHKNNSKALADLQQKLNVRLKELETQENEVVFKGTVPPFLTLLALRRWFSDLHYHQSPKILFCCAALYRNLERGGGGKRGV